MIRPAAITAALVLALLVGPVPAASADAHGSVLVLQGGIEVDLGAGWVTRSAVPLFSGAGPLVPGESRRASLDVRNASNITGPLTLAITSVDDVEVTCTVPELAAGDTTCAPGLAGEAAGSTRLLLTLDGAGPTTRVLFDGLLDPDPTGWSTTVVGFAPQQHWTVHAQVWLDAGADNRAQSDRVTFDLLLSVDGDLVDVAGDGLDLDSDGGGTISVTGAHSALLALVGGALLASGSALLAATRRRCRCATAATGHGGTHPAPADTARCPRHHST